jgi:hypothetical protein
MNQFFTRTLTWVAMLTACVLSACSKPYTVQPQIELIANHTIAEGSCSSRSPAAA